MRGPCGLTHDETAASEAFGLREVTLPLAPGAAPCGRSAHPG